MLLIPRRFAAFVIYFSTVLLLTSCDAGDVASQISRQVAKSTKAVPAEILDKRQATTQLKLDSQAMLEAGNYSKIEELAESARKGKERLQGGYWKIDAIYDGLANICAVSPGQMVTDSDWEARIAKLTEWKQRSDSITPRVALAAALIKYAWFARGSGAGNTVSVADSLLLRERLAAADSELREARSDGFSCPRWYREMLFVGMASGWPLEEFEQVYLEAINVEPGYLQAHIIKSDNLTQKWKGQPGDWRRFVDSIPDLVAKRGSDESDLVYFVVVANKLNDRSLRIDWTNIAKERIKNGYAQMEKRYGVDNFRLNQFAFVSALTTDYESARVALVRIGNDRDEKVWDEHSFELSKSMSDPKTLPDRSITLSKDIVE